MYLPSTHMVRLWLCACVADSFLPSFIHPPAHLPYFHTGVQPFTVFWIQLSKAWRTHMRGQRFCVMTASVMHYVPLMRDILQWLGGREVSKVPSSTHPPTDSFRHQRNHSPTHPSIQESILHALARRESVLLVPGGQQEMMESQSQMEEIRVITKVRPPPPLSPPPPSTHPPTHAPQNKQQQHVGFIRLALQNGVPLVPVLSFGEVEVMDFVRVPRLQRFFIERIGIPVPFFPYGLFGKSTHPPTHPPTPTSSFSQFTHPPTHPPTHPRLSHPSSRARHGRLWTAHSGGEGGSPHPRSGQGRGQKVLCQHSRGL